MRLGSFLSGMNSSGLTRQRTASLAGQAVGGAIGGFIAGPVGAQVGAQIGNAAGNHAGTSSPSNWKVTVSPPNKGAAYGVGVDDVPYGATVIQMTRGSGWGTSRPNQQQPFTGQPQVPGQNPNPTGQNPNPTPLIDRAIGNGGEPPTSLVDGTGTGGAAAPIFGPEEQGEVGDPSSYYLPPSGGMGGKAQTVLSSQFQ